MVGREATAEKMKGSRCGTIIKGPATGVKWVRGRGHGTREKGPRTNEMKGVRGPFKVSCIGAPKALVTPLTSCHVL